MKTIYSVLIGFFFVVASAMVSGGEAHVLGSALLL